MEHELANVNANNVETSANHNQSNANTNKSMIPTPSVTSKNSDSTTSTTSTRSMDLLSGRPEAVVRALQILEVREQLDRDRIGNSSSIPSEHMDDGEKALLREMCNVVWRKLSSDSPNSQDQ